MSRHLAEVSRADVLVHFAQNVVELAGSNIALHLLIPFVVSPTVEPGSKFGPLFKREPFNGGLDLVHAHRPKRYASMPFTATGEPMQGIVTRSPMTGKLIICGASGNTGQLVSEQAKRAGLDFAEKGKL
jgi:hypothetical protein